MSSEILWCVTTGLLAGEGSSLGAAYCERMGHGVVPMLLVRKDAPSIVVRGNPEKDAELGNGKPAGRYVLVDEEKP